MASTIPYLFFNGNCEEAFRYYEKLMGAKQETLSRFGEMPAAPGQVCPEGDKNKILNMSFRLGGIQVMASDAPAGRFEKPAGFAMTYSTETAAEVQRVFDGLAQGGNVGMPLSETFFAHSFGMVTDRFGTPWMVIAPK
ncbi:MAG: VOC family protein [Terriglobales bacterium]